MRRMLTLWCLVVFIVAMLAGCAEPVRFSGSQLEDEYQKLEDKMQNEAFASQAEMHRAYAKLFESISKGSAADADKLASLVRKITGDAYAFEDGDVFSLAADFSKAYAMFADGAKTGILDLTVQKGTSPKIEIAYLADVRYSVKMISAGEMWQDGEFTTAYNGELGAYVVEIAFYDSEAGKAFLEKYPQNKVHDLGKLFASDAPVSLKGSYNATHGYTVYIGSDAPFHVAEQAVTTPGWPMGTISVSLIPEA